MQTKLVNADAFDFLDATPSESIDCMITDPPYESLDKHRARGTTTRLDRWFASLPNKVWPAFFKAAYRVLKPNTHAYVFCDPTTMPVFVDAATSAGFKFWKPIIWDKDAIGMGYHYRCQYEMILFFEKGKRALNSRSISDVIRQKRIHPTHAIWPTEKPIPVARVLIEQSTAKGETVIDPFCGSAFVACAAVDTDRGFRCADIQSVTPAPQNGWSDRSVRNRVLKHLEGTDWFPKPSNQCCGGNDDKIKIHTNDCPLLD